jgi:hypothetical protein
MPRPLEEHTAIPSTIQCGLVPFHGAPQTQHRGSAGLILMRPEMRIQSRSLPSVPSGLYLTLRFINRMTDATGGNRSVNDQAPRYVDGKACQDDDEKDTRMRIVQDGCAQCVIPPTR